MDFETAFDVAARGYSAWRLPAFGLIFMLAGAVAAFMPRALAERLTIRLWHGAARVAFGFIMMAFATAWSCSTFWGTYLEYRTAVGALTSGSYQVVEGKVGSFVPMPRAGHAYEHFEVEGVKFAYSDFHVTPYFRNTMHQGGPIREGLHVRVTYNPSSLQNGILRLEIARK